MDDRMIIDFLAGRRRQLGITQKELGERTGISPNHIGRMERHELSPSIRVVARVCKALDVDISLTEMQAKN